MTLVLTIIALLGLIVFAAGGLVWLFSTPPRRPQIAVATLVGLIIWAIATIFLTIMALV